MDSEKNISLIEYVKGFNDFENYINSFICNYYNLIYKNMKK